MCDRSNWAKRENLRGEYQPRRFFVPPFSIRPAKPDFDTTSTYPSTGLGHRDSVEINLLVPRVRSECTRRYFIRVAGLVVIIVTVTVTVIVIVIAIAIVIVMIWAGAEGIAMIQVRL